MDVSSFVGCYVKLVSGSAIGTVARLLLETMTRTATSSGEFFHVNSVRNIDLQVALYPIHYMVSNYNDPVFSDPFAEYGGSGETNVRVFVIIRFHLRC